jgi:hypothetical protein
MRLPSRLCTPAPLSPRRLRLSKRLPARVAPLLYSLQQRRPTCLGLQPHWVRVLHWKRLNNRVESQSSPRLSSAMFVGWLAARVTVSQAEARRNCHLETSTTEYFGTSSLRGPEPVCCCLMADSSLSFTQKVISPAEPFMLLERRRSWGRR